MVSGVKTSTYFFEKVPYAAARNLNTTAREGLEMLNKLNPDLPAPPTLPSCEACEPLVHERFIDTLMAHDGKLPKNRNWL